MKQGKLYTVTKGNLFAFGDPIKRADVLASRLYGENYGDKGFTLQDYMNDNGNNWFGISKKNNPFSKMNIGNTAKAAGGAAAAVGSQIGVSDRNKRGMYDVLDPVHQLAGGRESGVGNALGDAGVGLFQAGASSGNPWLMAAGAAAKIVGGGINALAGIKTDEKAKKLADSDIATLSNMESNASSFDDVGTANLTTNASGVYKGGWFSGGRARRKNAALQADLDNSLALARNNINNNIQNIASDQMSNMMRNYAAYGGALGTAALPQYTEPGIGVAEYDFMKDYLTTKRMQAESKNKLSGVQSVAANNMFDMGGKKKKKDNRTILQKANDWFDETFPNRNKPVVEMIPEWLYTSPLKYLMNDDEQKTNYGGAVNSFNGQGAGGGWGTAPYIPKNTKRFSEAFDEARQAGAEDFVFGDKVYNTIKEANPIREFNNRIVGNSRTEKQIRARKGYGKDFGPIQTKEAVLPIIPYAEGGTLFALGGDYQTNGADWTNGLVNIGAGGSHESNPYEGVQMGIDPEGTPNLVEEGERIFNDYVYSKRIFADGGTLEKFHLSKKRKISFADLAGLLEKESKERPNDPISKAALKVQMEQLAEQQERQKQEMEAARAREAFEALSPEEQTAIMQQVAQQEQMAQQQAIQEQAAMQQQAAELPEMAAAEGQPVAEEMQSSVPTGAPMMAEGGKLYSPGGKLDDIYDAENDHFTVDDFNKAIAGQEEAIAANTAAVEKAVNKEVLKRIPKNLRKKMSIMQFLGSLGYKTVKEAEKAGWKPSDFGKYNNWNDIKNTTMLPDDFEWSDDYAARIDNPAMKAAMSLGYNPLLGTLQRQWYEGDNGNDVGWTQSVGKKALTAKEFNDYAKRYKNTLGWAIEQGLIKAPKEGETISTTDIMRAMQQSPDWQATDKWLYSDLANQAKYLGMAREMNPSDDTKFVSRWSPYGTFTQGEDGSWTYNLKDNLTDAEKQAFTDQFKRTRNDGWLGVMYNNFHDPGLTTNRYVLDEKGNPTLLLSDDLSGYEQVGGPFTWGDEDAGMNNQAIFYRAKGTGTGTGSAGAGSTDGKAKGDDWDVEPIHRNDKLRYAGLFGPAVGLGMQLAGIGRPDTSGLDAAVNMSRGAGHLADYQPIGDYMRYQPLDRLFYANQLQANARATDRNLMNTSGGNRGAAMAGLLANNYNTNNNLGNLWRQAEEYNLAQRERVAAFNKDTNKFNADAYNTTSRFNADALNRQGQYSAQLAMQAAREKMDADAAWNQGIYGNVAGLFKGIGDLGRENAQHNMIADMAATGIFGTIKNQPIGNDYIRVIPRSSAAQGGKIKRKKGKRGLTI